MNRFLFLLVFISSCLFQLGCSTTTVRTESTSKELSLEEWLAIDPTKRSYIYDEWFCIKNSSKKEIEIAKKLLFEDLKKQALDKLKKSWEEKSFSSGEFTMPIKIKTFGKAPKEGHSLYISMHGGGGAAPEVNDKQWNNQINLYQPKEGIYIAPRAPTDTWNLWHQAHIDVLFDELIKAAVFVAGVNPNKIYLTGYSAGGDGTFQLAPRMADRFAAAAMMAGHPNETTPDGLRNLPFAIFMGAKDAAYKRNELATKWGKNLDSLQKTDPNGYIHNVQIVPNKGHWMDRVDTVGINWMAQFTRNPLPQKIVWKQDDSHHETFYWIGVDKSNIKTGKRIVIERQNNTINILENYSESLSIYLNDEMLNLDKPVILQYQGKIIFEGKIPRKIQTVYKSIEQHLDEHLIFCSEIVVLNNQNIAP
jgi:predicted esterase